jgi:hypothetical protein
MLVKEVKELLAKLPDDQELHCYCGNGKRFEILSAENTNFTDGSTNEFWLNIEKNH